MNELLNSLSPSVLIAITLLTKITLILVLAGLLSIALRNVSAGFRHLVWSAAIVAIIALPVMSIFAPWKWDVRVLPLETQVVLPLTQSDRAAAVDIGAAPSTPLNSASQSALNPASSTISQPQSASWSLREKLLAIWIAGMALVAARLALGSFIISRMVKTATPLKAAEWQRPLVDVADRLEVPQLPGLFLSNRLPMPFACGVFRTAIVLPAEASDWTEDRRLAVLCHELAHLRRRDLVINTLAQFVLAIYWFHPLMWLAVRRLRIESERACDDLVLGIGTRASEYADHLLEILRGVPRSAVPVAVLPFADRGEFEGRVLAILERGARREPASRRGAVTVLSLGLLLVAPLAVLAPVHRVAPPSEQWSSQLITPSAREAEPTVSSSRPAPRPDQVAKPVAKPAPAVTDKSTQTETSTTVRTEIRATELTAADTGRVVIQSLIAALNDDVASVRENAAYSLGRLRATSAASALARLLERDPSASTREMSAWALGNMRSSEGNATLATVVQRDTSASVRATAVWALAQSDAQSALPALLIALKDKSTEIRGRAAWAIGSIRPESAPTQLIDATSDSSASVRQRAIWALGQIRDAAAVPALTRLVQDPSSDVREVALWAMGNMEGDAADAALVKVLQTTDPAMRAQAARALGGAHGRPWPWPWPMPR